MQKEKKKLREKGNENLFNFGEIKVESGVDPWKDLRSANKVSRIHDSNTWSHFSFFQFVFRNGV